ncbi:hypothetical protein [Sulfitobacter sp.]|uniref:hypothetical protein n=1 Tax=Sulfitobacter sp. TaxID=1903071 RepID=UPI00300305D1
MSILFGVLGALGAALIAAFTYSYQRTLDRKFEVIQERRQLYVDYVKEVSPSIYRRVLVDSDIHHDRLKRLNEIGSAMQIIAPQSVCDAHHEFLNYLREQTSRADPATQEHSNFFDDEAGSLFDMVLFEMRKDALPPELHDGNMKK